MSCPYEEELSSIIDINSLLFQHNILTCFKCVARKWSGCGKKLLANFTGIENLSDFDDKDPQSNQRHDPTPSTSISIKSTEAKSSEIPHWKLRHHRINALKQLYGMSTQEARLQFNKEEREKDIEQKKDSGFAKEKTMIERSDQPYRPPNKYLFGSFFQSRLSTLTSKEHRRLVAMLLEYGSTGRFRFEQQRFEFRDVMMRLRGESEAYHEFLKETIIAKSWEYYLRQLMLTSQRDFALLHCENAIERFKKIGLCKKYNHFSTIGKSESSSTNQGVILRVENALMRLNEPSKFCEPDLMRKCIIEDQNLSLSASTLKEIPEVPKDENVQKLLDKYPVDFAASLSTFRLLLCDGNPMTNDRADYHVPFEIRPSCTRGEMKTSVRLYKPLPRSKLSQETSCTLHAKYSFRQTFLKKISKGGGQLSRKNTIPIENTTKKSDSEQELEINEQADIIEVKKTDEMPTECAKPIQVEETREVFDIQSLLSKVKTSKNQEQPKPSEEGTPVENIDDYTPVAESSHRYTIGSISSSDHAFSLLIRSKVLGQRRTHIDQEAVSTGDCGAAKYRIGGQEMAESGIGVKYEFMANFGLEQLTPAELIYHYFTFYYSMAREYFVASIFKEHVVGLRRFTNHQWHVLRSYRPDFVNEYKKATEHLFSILTQLSALPVGDYILSRQNDGTLDVMRSTNEVNAAFNILSSYDKSINPRCLIIGDDDQKLRQFNGIDRYAVSVWHRVLSRAPATFPPRQDKQQPNIIGKSLISNKKNKKMAKKRKIHQKKDEAQQNSQYICDNTTSEIEPEFATPLTVDQWQLPDEDIL